MSREHHNKQNTPAVGTSAASTNSAPTAVEVNLLISREKKLVIDELDKALDQLRKFNEHKITAGDTNLEKIKKIAETLQKNLSSIRRELLQLNSALTPQKAESDAMEQIKDATTQLKKAGTGLFEFTSPSKKLKSELTDILNKMHPSFIPLNDFAQLDGAGDDENTTPTSLRDAQVSGIHEPEGEAEAPTTSDNDGQSHLLAARARNLLISYDVSNYVITAQIIEAICNSNMLQLTLLLQSRVALGDMRATQQCLLSIINRDNLFVQCLSHVIEIKEKEKVVEQPINIDMMNRQDVKTVIFKTICENHLPKLMELVKMFELFSSPKNFAEMKKLYEVLYEAVQKLPNTTVGDNLCMRYLERMIEEKTVLEKTQQKETERHAQAEPTTTPDQTNKEDTRLEITNSAQAAHRTRHLIKTGQLIKLEKFLEEISPLLLTLDDMREIHTKYLPLLGNSLCINYLGSVIKTRTELTENADKRVHTQPTHLASRVGLFSSSHNASAETQQAKKNDQAPPAPSNIKSK